MSYRDITVHELFRDVWLPGGTTLTSSPIDLGSGAESGYFSLQIHVVNSGCSVAAGYTLSNDGVNYIRSTDGYTIKSGASAFHHMCGVARNGRDLVVFQPSIAARMQVQLWETAGTGTSLTAHVAVH